MADDTWQHAAAYLYVLGVPDSCRAWEFLRRHTEYHDHYHSAVTAGSTSRPPAGAAERADDLVHQWGLQFLARSRPQR